MGQREQDIISEARITLNDVSDNPRWSDERLMKLLSDGQDEMGKSIPLLTSKCTITTTPGQTEYRLPEDSVKLLRASHVSTALQLLSYDEIERVSIGWEDDYGTVASIIVNALSQQTIRPYPMSKVSEPIKCRYHARPILLGWDGTDSEEELSINDMWDDGLKQYVIGMAFLDYGDESSISRSQIALGLYNKEFRSAQNLAKKSFAKSVRVTGYQARVSNSRRGDRYGSGSCRFGY